MSNKSVYIAMTQSFHTDDYYQCDDECIILGVFNSKEMAQARIKASYNEDRAEKQASRAFEDELYRFNEDATYDSDDYCVITVEDAETGSLDVEIKYWIEEHDVGG